MLRKTREITSFVFLRVLDLMNHCAVCGRQRHGGGGGKQLEAEVNRIRREISITHGTTATHTHKGEALFVIFTFDTHIF